MMGDYMYEKYGQKVCSTCKWNRYDKENRKYILDKNAKRHLGYFFCGNENSDYAGAPTLYDDTCEDWEERE